MDTAKLDTDLATLREHADRWARLPIHERIDYLKDVLAGTVAVGDRQVQAAIQAKGVPAGGNLEAEDYLGGPVVQARTIRLLINSLMDLNTNGRVDIAQKNIRTRDNGQVAVKVLPAEITDSLLFGGFEAEIWMQDGVTEANLHDNIAEHYRTRNEETPGRVALVLGAGNVASIGPLDVIHKLFVEGQVCVLKMNPVNEYLGPFIEESFGRLVSDGYVRLAYGGADVGEYLCNHAEVDEIHITGSDRTHDIIVFGPGDEGKARKEGGNPRNTKHITSELGNVSPVIIMPGSWTQSDLRFQAENIATQMTNNGGFNCNAAKVLILHDQWPQRVEFMDMLRSVLASLPQRPAYYPGAEERYDRFVGGHAQSQAIGERGDGILPWTLIPDVDAQETDDPCFTQESFCGVTAQTTLPGKNSAEFLNNAVRFCNEILWGTLNACIIVHPQEEKRLGNAIDQAVSTLEYGSVAINHWPGLCYGMGSTAWGAYPGHTLEDIQSGIGSVHNTYLFDRPQKSVLRGPFKVFPKPPWFVTHGRGLHVAKKLKSMESNPSIWKVFGIAWQAIRGS